MPDRSRPAAPRALFDTVQAHFATHIVPLWQGPGWNAELALPYEALDAAHRPLPVQRYRAMACARQLYLFSSLIDQPAFPAARERAAALFQSLQRHFHDAKHGGWFYSIDPHGAPLDTSKDLYTHAFVIFACAHYWARVRDAQIEAVLDEALALLHSRFADGRGLYEASLARDWSSRGTGPLQNPLMHLAEALLAVLAAREDSAVQRTLLALVDALQARFIEPDHGLMLEKPRGAADNWFEPGHQFEWFFLLQSSPLLRGTPLHASLEQAFVYAEQVGVRADGGVLAMLAADGTPRDSSQRIWAQAEYIRALTLRPHGDARVQQQLQVLHTRFLHAGGWHESLDGEGRLSRPDMPSTTPYHLATCYTALAERFA
ncbi:AGE family epimerase/isomerase [Pseudomonas sp. PDM14]|uniref:AGE family epimerase/isomerase n=1 Tax=Pseudomonas sp. PDM14 TaxID=2769288 RepID=UPI00178198F4|nr:AGE family epimerase/isomerase [Pseudomonas sp. PDM14]MBD9483548.1 AGE family epimerase/isomerase [Pseudomonas sp. PDM14]